MNFIEFINLDITSTRIDVEARTSDASYNLYFEFSESLSVSTTAVAIAMSTLCGRAFDKVFFDFPVTEEALHRIRELTHCDVEARCLESPKFVRRRGNLLSFSGGFDSMAAKMLMPEETNLVSMDFGGRFSREREFFESFETLRVSTNIVETPLRSNSWSFMGIGSILASDYFRSEFHTFGGILEAGPDNMRIGPAAAQPSTFPPFRAAGYTNAPYVLGLTEIGTLSVMLRQDPGIVARSLRSVASPGEEKLYRKSVLADVVSETLGIDLTPSEIPAPRSPHFQFGKNFALDLLTLYVISKTGEEDARGLARDIPNTAIALASRVEMKFMERANPTLFEYFPRALAPQLNSKLAENDIRWYSEKDWSEFQMVRDFMQAYHPVVAT